MAIVRDGLSVTQRRVWTTVACLLTVHLAGCGGSNSSASNSSAPVTPPSGSILQPTTMDLSSGFTYDYTAGAGSDVTDTQVQSGSNVQSIVGVGYFTTNSFVIDYTTGMEGWK